MIPVFMPDVARVAPSLLPREGLVVRSQAKFASLVRGCSIAVVFCGRPGHDRDFVGWLQNLCVQNPLVSFLLVVPFDSLAIRRLAPVPCASIVWEEDLPNGLSAEVNRFAAPNVWSTLDQVAFAASGFAPATRKVIQRLCDPHLPPVAQLSELLLGLPYSESAFRRWWTSDFGRFTPKLMIDWVLLLRGLDLAGMRLGSQRLAVAVKLGIHERTLDRVSLRLTGRTFAANQRPEAKRLSLTEFRACLASLSIGLGQRRCR